VAKASKKPTSKAKPGKSAPRPAHRAVSKASSKTRPVARAESSKPAKQAVKPRQVLVETRAVSRKVVPTLPPKKTINHAPPAIIPTPVPTDGKPRKNQAGFSPRELEQFRELLLAKRRELVGDMSSMEREALRSTTGTNLSNLPIHMADMGTDNYEQEFTLGLVEKDRQLLREINSALAKIQNGTYGICEGTGKPIAKARLEVIPWAKYGIDYARQLEKGQIRR
jgi:DnaK suppressor protein